MYARGEAEWKGSMVEPQRAGFPQKTYGNNCAPLTQSEEIQFNGARIRTNGLNVLNDWNGLNEFLNPQQFFSVERVNLVFIGLRNVQQVHFF